MDAKVEGGGEPARLAEDHVAVAGKAASVRRAVGINCPDDQVIEAVAVDVAR